MCMPYTIKPEKKNAGVKVQNAYWDNFIQLYTIFKLLIELYQIITCTSAILVSHVNQLVLNFESEYVC